MCGPGRDESLFCDRPAGFAFEYAGEATHDLLNPTLCTMLNGVAGRNRSLDRCADSRHFPRIDAVLASMY